MSLIDKKALLDAMNDAKTAAAPLAIAIGRDKDYIRDFLKGRKASLKLEDIQKIADELNVPISRLTRLHTEDLSMPGIEVVGTVAAGVYRDISVEDQETEKPRVAIARDLRFPHAKQYALKIQGDSMDELFPDGSTVVCVDYIDSGIDLRSGMAVHVERYMMGGQLVETTLKEVHRKGKGPIMLQPRSTNPIHKPFEASATGEGEVQIRGIVIGEWRPMSYGF